MARDDSLHPLRLPDRGGGIDQGPDGQDVLLGAEDFRVLGSADTAAQVVKAVSDNQQGAARV